MTISNIYLYMKLFKLTIQTLFTFSNLMSSVMSLGKEKEPAYYPVHVV